MTTPIIYEYNDVITTTIKCVGETRLLYFPLVLKAVHCWNNALEIRIVLL